MAWLADRYKEEARRAAIEAEEAAYASMHAEELEEVERKRYERRAVRRLMAAEAAVAGGKGYGGDEVGRRAERRADAWAAGLPGPDVGDGGESQRWFHRCVGRKLCR